ncbi:MAG TPA: cytochrome c-type biogenesis protein [Gaiellaceae bacterium]|nr:cytochrome c-type biogenesis protein [Gaiellaceae bacterium]
MSLPAAAVCVAATLLLASAAAASESRPTLGEIEREVVCPSCHTTLDQSSSPVADRMRTFIRARIAAGDTKSEIKDKLVADFGEQVLASPPKRGFNLLAWVLPPVVTAIGAAILAGLAIRWSRRRGDAAGDVSPPDPALDRRIDDELARLD